MNKGSLNHLLCIFLSVLIVGEFVIVVALCVKGLADAQFKGLQEFTSRSSFIMKTVQAASCLAASMELITAVALTWNLRKGRTQYNVTKSTINVLIAYAINTGFISCINFTFLFMSIFIWPKTYMWCFFSFLVSSLETNACLGALNGRSYFKQFRNEINGTSFAV